MQLLACTSCRPCRSSVQVRVSRVMARPHEVAGRRRIVRADDFVEISREHRLLDLNSRPHRAPTLEENCLWWLNLTAALVVLGLVAAILAVSSEAM
eukprot:747254-Hanusia_phi.AAC.2